MTGTVSAPTSGREALTERLVAGATTTMEMFSIHLGRELGLYAALAAAASTSAELADRAGIHPRYAREWLEQQAVAGIVGVDDPAVPARARVYRLPADAAEVLLDGTSPYFVGPLAAAVTGIGGVLDQVAAAYRTGGGVRFEAYGPDIRHGIGAMNAAMFANDLPTWLEAIPDVVEKLGQADAKVLDLGCGTGSSSLVLAGLLPRCQVLGMDLDGPSVQEARQHAAESGLADRVTFIEADAARLAESEFTLVTVFEALHDMADPVGVLRAAGRALAPGGAILLADERAAETFAPPGDLLERFLYGWSVGHCLPATMAENPVVASGTVLRAETVRAWAGEAGLTVEVLPIDNDFWRFYRLGG